MFVFHVPGRLVAGDGHHRHVVPSQALAEHLFAQTGGPGRVSLQPLEVLHEVCVAVGVAVSQVAGGISSYWKVL